jgi:ferredoxin-NADP reductase
MLPVTIAAIRQGTPTVKVFTLATGGERLHFFAGQWVDCYAEIEGELAVAGYSLTSSPTVRDTIEIAVKRNDDQPVTRFLHERASVGDRLFVEGGQGNCYFTAGMAPALVLIAGGIGITPLISIARYVRDAAQDVRVTLIHSARTADEHLFRAELEQMAAEHPRFRYVFVVSRPDTAGPTGHAGRIDRRLLLDLGIDRSALYYICGPGQMIDDVAALLRDLGVPDAQLRFERWW